MANFEDKKSSNDTTINETMSDDEVIASNVIPRGTCLKQKKPFFIKNIIQNTVFCVIPYSP